MAVTTMADDGTATRRQLDDDGATPSRCWSALLRPIVIYRHSKIFVRA